MKNRLFEIWFSLCCGVGNREFPQLLERFGTPYDLYNADENELEGLPCSRSLRVRLGDKSLERAKDILDYCSRNNVGILFWQDENYPASLRPLQDPPVLLYYRGKLPDLSKSLCISVVGTRSMSEYGKRIAYKIGYELGAAGTVVVSGMALGNDGVAAAGAILSGGTTLAVLGCGIDEPYPREHRRLFDKITECGAVLSEFPPATPPERKNFPIRNRIISGLSQGTVVVEGDLRSGALITARTAILQGRDIYAFPGNVGQTNSAGSNQLISDGATMILCARDLLENYAFPYGDAIRMERLMQAEARSDIDEAGLERLGVCVRTEKPKAEETFEPSAAVNPPPRDRRREAPPHTHREGATPKPAALPKSVPAHGDNSERALKSLTETQRRIFEALPLDHAVAIDYFTRQGYSVGEVMAAMTVLEIKGLTVTLPGALFSRK